MKRLDLTPRAAAPHWSAGYIGRAWDPAFDCWALVREVQLLHFGRELPAQPQVSVQGWHTAEAPAQAGDVLTMQGSQGPHIGVMVDSLRVLHNVGGLVDGQPQGAVQIDAVDELARLGYGRLRLWRPA